MLRTHAASEIKDSLTRLLIPLLGHGLLTSEGDFWRRQRKLAQPAFQHNQIEGYAAEMVAASLHCEEWAGSARAGTPREVHDDFSALTLSIVSKTLFGADVGACRARIGPALAFIADYYLNPYKWFAVRRWLPTRENRDFRAAVRLIDDVVFDLIRQRRAAVARGGPHGDDLLGRLLAAQDERRRRG